MNPKETLSKAVKKKKKKPVYKDAEGNVTTVDDAFKRLADSVNKKRNK